MSELSLRNSCMARMLPREAEFVLEWTGLQGVESVKRFERHLLSGQTEDMDLVEAHA